MIASKKYVNINMKSKQILFITKLEDTISAKLWKISLKKSKHEKS